MTRTKAKKPVERKSEATRRRLLERALALFQKRGVDKTTMRDIARAAKLSLGAAYYYFPSKDALLFAYYEDNQRSIDEVIDAVTGTPRERLGQIFHAKLESIRPHRKMLASLLGHLVDPSDSLSTFSPQNRAVRERAIAGFARALEGAVSPDAIPLVAHALWLFHLAAMLLFVSDNTPNQSRTHSLVNEALDLVVPLLPILATPMGLAMCERIISALERAGITLASESAR